MSDDALSFFMPDDRNWIAELIRETGNRSQVIVPLVGQGRHLGNFHLARRVVRSFTSAHATILHIRRPGRHCCHQCRAVQRPAVAARQEAMTDCSTPSAPHAPTLPRFAALARQADRLCGGTGALVAMRQGDGLSSRRAPATSDRTSGSPRDTDRRQHPVRGRAKHREIIHIRNWDDEPADRYPDAPSRRAGARARSPSPCSATTSRSASSPSPESPREDTPMRRCRC